LSGDRSRFENSKKKCIPTACLLINSAFRKNVFDIINKSVYLYYAYAVFVSDELADDCRQFAVLRVTHRARVNRRHILFSLRHVVWTWSARFGKRHVPIFIDATGSFRKKRSRFDMAGRQDATQQFGCVSGKKIRPTGAVVRRVRHGRRNDVRSYGSPTVRLTGWTVLSVVLETCFIYAALYAF